MADDFIAHPRPKQGIPDLSFKDLKRIFCKDRLFEDELKEANHAKSLYLIKDEIDLSRVNVEGAMIENMRKMAETNMLNAQTAEVWGKSKFIGEILQSIDIRRLPPYLQTYIVACIFNPSSSDYAQFEMQQELKEHVKAEKEAQAGKAFQEAEKVKQDARYREYEADQQQQEAEFQKHRKDKRIRENLE